MARPRNKEFLRLASASGFEIDSLTDDTTEVPCPRNCGGNVVYNGNYFCGCGWALPAESNKTSKAEKEFAELLLEGLLETRAKRKRHAS